MHPDTFHSRLIEFERRSLRFLAKGQDVDDTHLLTVNECGECIACCVNPAISAEQFRELGMPPTQSKPYGKRCVHCTGKGCGVYSVRPSVCKGYQCFWKFGLVDAPPNVTGVAWSIEPNHETLRGWVIVGQSDDSEATLASQERLAEIRQLLSINLMGLDVDFVIVRCTKQVNLVKPRHGSRLLVKTCDLDYDHSPDQSTLRSRILHVRSLQPTNQTTP